jgi:hypothetical protein
MRLMDGTGIQKATPVATALAGSLSAHAMEAQGR